MKYNNYFNWLEKTYRIEINSELRDVLQKHFGDNLNIYSEQDMYEQTRKVIQKYQERYLIIKFSKYEK